MNAPRPKRLTRQDRLHRQAVIRRADAREAIRDRTIVKRKGGQARIGAVLEAKLQGRAAGRCEACGNALRGRCQRHHRKLRSQGGLDQASNLVIICANCHNMIHNNDAWARQNGWIVNARANPATVAVTLHDGRRVRLTNDGDYQQVAA